MRIEIRKSAIRDLQKINEPFKSKLHEKIISLKNFPILSVVYCIEKRAMNKVMIYKKLLKEIKLPKDILVPKLDEYNFYKNEFASVYKDIEDKGIVLWSL